ncbi:DNA mismatch repair protein MLH3-like protein [Drosera capensis]
MESIKPLPESVRSSLRSGFVICDLTRVVEELVYNSLDAGATRISVSLGVGTGYIKVEDDGFGIGREGLILLGERYATSKFHSKADGSGSFGFLGETLCSISDISLLEIITKTQGRPNGYRKGCKCVLLGIDDDRREVGTTVIVRDLFYNQPVRRRLLQSSPKKALHLVKKCVSQVALMQSKVSFKVFDLESEDELLRWPAASSPLPALRNESGMEVSSLEEMNLSDGAFKLEGYVSSSCDPSATKVVQYMCILDSSQSELRVLGKGPIHKLLNHLANKFLYQSNGDHIGKRSRPQACPVYILNLMCPRSFYDLIFESSGTSVEFKDWSPVISFLKKALASVWGRNIFKADKIAKNEMGKQGVSVSAEKGWTDTHGSSRKRRRIQNEESPGFPYFSSEMKGEDGCSLFREHHFDEESRESQTYCARFEKPHIPEKFTYRTGRLGSINHSGYNHTWEFSNKTCVEIDEFLDDVSHEKRDFSYAEDSNLNSWCEDESVIVDANPMHSEAGRTTLKRLHFGNRSRCKKSDTDDMTPFLQSCSLKPQEDDALSRSGKNFDIQMDHFVVKPCSSYSHGSDSYTPVELNSVDHHSFDGLVENLWKNDLDTCSWLPIGDVASDWHEDLDNISRHSQNSFSLYDGRSFKEDTRSLVGEERELDFSCFSSNYDWRTATYDPLLHAGSLDFEWSDQDVRLGSLKSTRNSRLEEFKGEGRDGYLDYMKGEFYESSSRSFIAFDHDTSPSGFQSCEYNLVGPSRNFGEVLFPTRKSTFIDMSCEDFVDSSSASSRAYNKKVNLDLRRFHQKHHASSSRSCRSHSAPPIYKGRRRFSLTDHSLAAVAVNSDVKTVHDAQKFGDGTLVKQARRACTQQRQNPEKCDSEVPCAVSKYGFYDLTFQPYDKLSISSFPHLSCNFRLNVNGTSDSVLPNSKTQKNDLHGSHGHDYGSSMMEDQDSASLWCKWRNDVLPGVGQLVFSEGGNNTRKFPDECSVLDVSTGILHLACDSLIPKSVNRSCLEDAKVLLQVDKKFIPVVAGGTLAVIDQHAADERIRLEELHKKVLSGEMKSISYLEAEKELVLPEMTYQLLYNYADSIQTWGWVCSIHAQATDGSSTMPQAVLRVLNYKACRGAIMFGDTLLPSECSLIVEELRKTSLCFQCAHGRPTTAPLINLEVLHKQIATLTKNRDVKSWHGLRREDINLERAMQRLDSAKG